MTPEEINRARNSQRTTNCAACNRPKRAEDSFCIPCYARLPGDMQRSLWAVMMRDYAPAYTLAYRFLTRSEKPEPTVTEDCL
jgi:hypothetical protein